MPGYKGRGREVILSEGFSEFQCDVTVCPVVMAIFGVLPPPNCIVYAEDSCQPLASANLGIAKHFNVLIY